MSKTITIPLDQFAELIRKECAYDMFARYVQNDKYASEIEKMLFVVSNEKANITVEDTETKDNF